MRNRKCITQLIIRCWFSRFRLSRCGCRRRSDGGFTGGGAATRRQGRGLRRQRQTGGREGKKGKRALHASPHEAARGKPAAKSAERRRNAAGRHGNCGRRAANGGLGFDLGALARGPAAKNKDLRPRDSSDIWIPVMSFFSPSVVFLRREDPALGGDGKGAASQNLTRLTNPLANSLAFGLLSDLMIFGKVSWTTR